MVAAAWVPAAAAAGVTLLQRMVQGAVGQPVAAVAVTATMVPALVVARAAQASHQAAASVAPERDKVRPVVAVVAQEWARRVARAAWTLAWMPSLAQPAAPALTP